MQNKNVAITLVLLIGFLGTTEPKKDSYVKPKQELVAVTKTKTLPKIGRRRLNLMVYFAGNNDLHAVCIKQMEQMACIGSMLHVNFLTQLDVKSEPKVKRYFIAKNNIMELETITEGYEAISGTPESLAFFVEWGMKNFPADDLFLVISNHGDGIKDRDIWGTSSKKRGIGFNTVANCYLTNQGLEWALNYIAHHVLKKKISLVLTDACFMSMVEVCSQIKQAASIFVGSQDTEPFLGYNYIDLCGIFGEPFYDSHLNPEAFARYAVRCYIEEHIPANKPITHAAIDVTQIAALEDNMALLGQKLAECIDQKAGFFEVIQQIRNHQKVSFRDPDYIDLYRFYESLVDVITPTLNTNSHRRKEVVELARQGMQLFENCILMNMTGPLSSQAKGLSVYFPQYIIHQSYYGTIFNHKTGWSNFLKTYLYHSYYKTRKTI